MVPSLPGGSGVANGNRLGMHNSCTKKKNSIGQVRLVVAYTKLFTTQICLSLLVLRD